MTQSCSQAAACGGVQATPRAVLRQQRVSAYVRQLMARPSMQGQRIDPFRPLGAVARPRPAQRRQLPNCSRLGEKAARQLGIFIEGTMTGGREVPGTGTRDLATKQVNATETMTGGREAHGQSIPTAATPIARPRQSPRNRRLRSCWPATCRRCLARAQLMRRGRRGASSPPTPLTQEEAVGTRLSVTGILS